MRYLYVLLLFGMLASCGSKTCRLHGTIEDAKDGDTLLLITDIEHGIPSDTFFVKGGHFDFVTEVDSIRLCILQRTGADSGVFPFFLEPGDINITLKKDFIASVVGGTHLNDEWQSLNEAGVAYQKAMDELSASAQKDTTEQNLQSVIQRLNEAQTRLSEKYYKTAEKNIGNELGFVLVSNPVALSEEQVLRLINQMPSDIRSRRQIRDIEEYIKGSSSAGASSGKMPDFSAKDPQGKMISAMEEIKKHKLTIIDFWASWCSPCMREMPHMVELYQLYQEKGLGILGVSLDTDAEAWKSAIQQSGSSWTHISELESNSKIAQMFGVRAIPFTLIVDNEGNVLGSALVGNELEDFVRNYLQDK